MMTNSLNVEHGHSELDALHDRHDPDDAKLGQEISDYLAEMEEGATTPARQ